MPTTNWAHTTDTSTPCIDADGNEYSTVTIGSQVWMKENLKVTHYNDDSAIPTGYFKHDWINLSTGAYEVYPVTGENYYTGIGYTPFDMEEFCGENCGNVFGNLYNWHAVNDSRGIAPDGWHIPTDEEWTILITHLDEDTNPDGFLNGTHSLIAGGKMKSTGTIEGGDGLWVYIDDYGEVFNVPGDNQSGFTGLPSGGRNIIPVPEAEIPNTGYFYMGFYGYFWSSTPYVFEGLGGAFYRFLSGDSLHVDRAITEQTVGFPVRCVRDDLSDQNLWSTFYPLLMWHTWGNETTDNWENWG